MELEQRRAQAIACCNIDDVVFVADDLAGWLVGLLADAGRKKLTTVLSGTDQERALRSAASAAVLVAARELRQGDDEEAEQVALVISQVFSKPVPDALTGHTTVMEALQAGITRQLAVLDDASLTGTGQSSADVLGISGAILAEKLTDHLLREIVIRGSRGGPLQPLADQLNHEMTRFQIRDAAREVGRVILEALARQDSTRTAERPGSQILAYVAIFVDQLLDGLALGDHEEAERRVNRLFVQLYRDQQQAAVEAIIRVAATTKDHTSQLLTRLNS